MGAQEERAQADELPGRVGVQGEGGDEGLCVAYDMVEFVAPVYAGDYIEAEGELVNVGNTSRKMRFEARKVIRQTPQVNDSAAEVLDPPVVVCRATGTCVTMTVLVSASAVFGGSVAMTR